MEGTTLTCLETYSDAKKRTLVSIMASIVISNFLHCIILVTISGKSFFQQNFNLKWARIGSWMLLDVLFHFTAGSVGPPLKNVRAPSVQQAKNYTVPE
jgi:hypothetical protein